MTDLLSLEAHSVHVYWQVSEILEEIYEASSRQFGLLLSHTDLHVLQHLHWQQLLHCSELVGNELGIAKNLKIL